MPAAGHGGNFRLAADAPTPLPSARRGRRRLRATVRVGLIAGLLLPLISGSLGAPQVATGDELSDALARQKSIESKIAAQKHKVAELNGLQADLRVVIKATSAKLNGINADLADVRADVKQMTIKVNAIQVVYDGQVAQLADLDAQLADITAQESAKAAQLAERKELLADHLRAAYDSDRTSVLETILSADSFSDAIADVGYLIDIGAQDRALARQITKDQATLAALHQTVAQTRFDTDQLRAETAAQKKVLDKSLADLKKSQRKLKKLEAATVKALAAQQKAYRTLAQSASAARRILADQARENRAIDRKIHQLLARQNNGAGIPSEYSGTLDWPMAGTITQEFGCTGFSWEPPVRELRPLPPGNRHRRPARHADPGGRPRQGPLRRSAVGRGVGRDHRPQPAPPDAVRPRQDQHPGARRPDRPEGPGHRLRRNDRSHNRAAPPLGRPARPRLEEPAPVPLAGMLSGSQPTLTGCSRGSARPPQDAC